MQIVHFSDFHLRGDGQLSFGVVDTRACLQTAFAHFQAMVQKPDLFVITGDLADSGDDQAYHMLYDTFAPLGIPVYALPGNHDRRDRMRRILQGWCPENTAVAPHMCYTVEFEVTRLLMLDTLVPGSHSGHCLPVVLDWLEAELARRPCVPALLFMHHPPFRTGMGMMDEAFEGVDRLHALVSAAPHVRLCCGHMHRPIMTQWAGCLALTAPSVAMQIELDLSPCGGDTFRMETPGYLVHHWEQGSWNSHVCQIACAADFSGPHRFIGSVNPVEHS